jgi:hypothetical protein
MSDPAHAFEVRAPSPLSAAIESAHHDGFLVSLFSLHGKRVAEIVSSRAFQEISCSAAGYKRHRDNVPSECMTCDPQALGLSFIFSQTEHGVARIRDLDTGLEAYMLAPGVREDLHRYYEEPMTVEDDRELEDILDSGL